jgi:hypothetical protein
MRNLEPQYPKWRNTTPVLLDAETVHKAEGQIAGCESCAPAEAEIPFDYVLDSLTGYDPENTDYILPETARCPACSEPLLTGYWRWSDSEEAGRTVFILPATLVVLKKEERPAGE